MYTDFVTYHDGKYDVIIIKHLNAKTYFCISNGFLYLKGDEK